MRIPCGRRLGGASFGLVGALALLASAAAQAACSSASDHASSGPGGSGTGSASGAAGGSNGAGAGATTDGGAGSYYDAGIVIGPDMHPCASTSNAVGKITEFAWPNAMNDGNQTFEDQTVRFDWTGTSANLLQVEGWWGQSGAGAPVGYPAPGSARFADRMWPGELTSGPASASTSTKLEWNLGHFPCGWRPGLFYFADAVSQSITVWDLSVPEADSLGAPNADYAPKPCSQLADPTVYDGRYAAYATRSGCTQYEVNNFQTNSGYDFVTPTEAVKQGDLVLFRWSGLHNVIQVHDQSQDEPFASGGIGSGARTLCVPGPNYTCANGSLDLGEYMIDTASYRPGYIHLSDQCAYWACSAGTPHACPTACDSTKAPYDVMGYGTGSQLFLQRPVRPTPPVAGACCAIDPKKGKACRLVDLYNDNDGTQFDTGLGGGVSVNRGDLVRFRWAGAVRIVQTQTTTAMLDTGVQPKPPIPMQGGVAMPAAVECVPGPNWGCLGGNTAAAELVFDVDQAMTASHFQTFSYGGDFFEFHAYADNASDPYMTTQDSDILLPVNQATAYANNPPCE